MGSVFLLLTLPHIITVQRSSAVAVVSDIVEFCPTTDLEKEAPLCTPGSCSGDKGGWLISRIALAFVMVEYASPPAPAERQRGTPMLTKAEASSSTSS
jgi:hypothetical protein